MSQTARDVIDAALARWLDNEPAAYVPIRDDILAALAAAGLVVVPSRLRDEAMMKRVLLAWCRTPDCPDLETT